MAEYDSGDHWFSGRDTDVLLYRVNRRPLDMGTLFEGLYEEQQPEDSLRHVQENLLDFEPLAVTGTQYRRYWYVGNIRVDLQRGYMTGRIGWRRDLETVEEDYDPATRSWRDQIRPGQRTAVAPFAYLREGHYLGVLHHPDFTERNVPDAFRQLLNNAETEKEQPTTDWDVEPVGNTQEFYDWLRRTDRVTRLDFVFKRPNHDAEPEFRAIWAQLDEFKAKTMRHQIATDATAETGLNTHAILQDPTVKGFLMAAMAAFGYAIGRGVRLGRVVTYDQRSQVARARLADVAPDWEAATTQVLQGLIEAVQRRRDNQ